MLDRQQTYLLYIHNSIVSLNLVCVCSTPVCPLSLQEQQKAVKIVLCADNETQLVQVLAAARDAHLQTHCLSQATRDPEHPRTRTIMAIGPAPASVVDQITQQLALLG